MKWPQSISPYSTVVAHTPCFQRVLSVQKKKKIANGSSLGVFYVSSTLWVLYIDVCERERERGGGFAIGGVQPQNTVSVEYSKFSLQNPMISQHTPHKFIVVYFAISNVAHPPSTHTHSLKQTMCMYNVVACIHYTWITSKMSVYQSTSLWIQRSNTYKVGYRQINAINMPLNNGRIPNHTHTRTQCDTSRWWIPVRCYILATETWTCPIVSGIMLNNTVLEIGAPSMNWSEAPHYTESKEEMDFV